MDLPSRLSCRFAGESRGNLFTSGSSSQMPVLKRAPVTWRCAIVDEDDTSNAPMRDVCAKQPRLVGE